MTDLTALQDATRAARMRPGGHGIGTRINQGRIDIVRVAYDSRGRSTVDVIRGRLTLSEALAALGRMSR
jgi:hypothetical protein